MTSSGLSCTLVEFTDQVENKDKMSYIWLYYYYLLQFCQVYQDEHMIIPMIPSLLSRELADFTEKEENENKISSFVRYFGMVVRRL